MSGCDCAVCAMTDAEKDAKITRLESDLAEAREKITKAALFPTDRERRVMADRDGEIEKLATLRAEVRAVRDEDWKTLRKALEDHIAGECPVDICNDGESGGFCAQMTEAFDHFEENLTRAVGEEDVGA